MYNPQGDRACAHTTAPCSAQGSQHRRFVRHQIRTGLPNTAHKPHCPNIVVPHCHHFPYSPSPPILSFIAAAIQPWRPLRLSLLFFPPPSDGDSHNTGVPSSVREDNRTRHSAMPHRPWHPRVSSSLLALSLAATLATSKSIDSERAGTLLATLPLSRKDGRALVSVGIGTPPQVVDLSLCTSNPAALVDRR